MTGSKHKPLILASASPQRRKLLKTLRVPYEVIPSRVSERSAEKNPRRLVLLLARRKAVSIARRRPDSVVIGADTIVVCRGEILGKPKNPADSRRILSLLNGRSQRIYTGVAVATEGGKKIFSEAAVSRAFARRLNPARLEALIGKHMDKAGAYAVQDRHDPFIKRIEGPLDNVIGLPMKTVRRLLKRAGR